MTLSPAVRADLKAIVGPAGWLEADAEMAPFLRDERDLFQGQADLVLRPASSDEVARVVALCHREKVALVPQGGNTGYVGGSVPLGEGAQILLSLGRMNKILEVDALDGTMTVQAGCVLADIQAAAEAADRLFPLSLGAEGSCQIGGNLSTNAGGVNVVKYGNARDLVLGLEVVLPDGTLWDGLRRLRKDNSGYDLKQLFIGAEGTLGVITAAVLKLFPRPKSRCCCLVAVPSLAATTLLLARFKSASGDAVSSFEYMQRSCLDLVLGQISGTRDPLETKQGHYVLAELASGQDQAALQALVEEILSEAFEAGEAVDGVIAASEEQARGLWRLRETIPEAQKRAGASIKHDVSVPVSRVPRFIEQGAAIVAEILPEALLVPFGHLGDGNIHFNLTQPKTMTREAFLAETPRINRRIHDLAVEMGGSFSAEHGVGLLKKDELAHYKDPVALDLMRRIKDAIDPGHDMNPGKML